MFGLDILSEQVKSCRTSRGDDDDDFLPERVPRPPKIGVAGNASSSTSEPGPSAASNVPRRSMGLDHFLETSLPSLSSAPPRSAGLEKGSSFPCKVYGESNC